MTTLRGRRSLVMSASLPIVLMTITACQSGGDAESGAAPAALSSAVESAISSGGQRIPVGVEKATVAFQGPQADFLASTRSALALAKMPAPASTARMVEVGQQFCAVLSGGGEVARKVDYWAGQNDLAGDDWAAVFVGSLSTYCPSYTVGYLRARTDPLQPTPSEEADLARYVVRRSLVGGGQVTGPLDDRTDAQIARRGTALCRNVTGKITDGGTPAAPTTRAALATELGLLEIYCSEAAESALESAVRSAAGLI